MLYLSPNFPSNESSSEHTVLPRNYFFCGKISYTRRIKIYIVSYFTTVKKRDIQETKDTTLVGEYLRLHLQDRIFLYT